MSDSNPQQQWHMKKEINIAHLLSTVAMLVTGFAYLSGLSERVSSNASNISHVKELRKEDQRRTEKQLDSINKKLDKLLEK